MKLYAIAALISTTQADAGAAWAKADETDGCTTDHYSCTVYDCEDGANTGDVCLPNAATADKEQSIKSVVEDIGEAFAGAYGTDIDCKAKTACPPPAEEAKKEEAAPDGASNLLASAAAAATAIYILV